ncbi:MAG TPA: hypothetical protein VFB63_15065 [Bryobacteraceae bacterium]|nr:hypothetical protein [Bryobacteraceae bacterium]
MKTRLVGIAALSTILAASAAFAEAQKTPARKKAAPSGEAKPKTAAAPSDAKDAAPTPKPAPKSEPATPAAQGRVTQVYTPKLPPLPEGAVQVDKHTWRATEKDGKVWMYRRTPFGFSKYEADEKVAEEALTDLVAIDKGDSVEFQRKTPFGLSKWTKKKSELDDNEAAALKRATPASSKGAQE